VAVDLVYLDPPFNSNADYNVHIAEHDGTRAAAQIKAFEDTWTWDEGRPGRPARRSSRAWPR
jgi:site-specific DNA-methyltransferase (adenine-specific)